MGEARERAHAMRETPLRPFGCDSRTNSSTAFLYDIDAGMVAWLVVLVSGFCDQEQCMGGGARVNLGNVWVE